MLRTGEVGHRAIFPPFCLGRKIAYAYDTPTPNWYKFGIFYISANENMVELAPKNQLFNMGSYRKF